MAGRSLTLVALLVALPGACERAREPAPAHTGSAPAKAEEPADPGGWAYLPTLRAHAPEGTHMLPLLELEEPSKAHIDIIVAVARPEGPSIEMWRFVAQPPEGNLAPASEPAPIVRTRADQTRAPALSDLRSRMAAPRNRLRRPVGLTPTAEDLPVRLSALAARVRDVSATPRQRTEALASLVRGVDDSLVFEADQLPAVIDLFAEGPTAGELKPEGTRRATMTLASHELSLAKKSDGWVLTRLDERAAEPSAKN